MTASQGVERSSAVLARSSRRAACLCFENRQCPHADPTRRNSGPPHSHRRHPPQRHPGRGADPHLHAHHDQGDGKESIIAPISHGITDEPTFECFSPMSRRRSALSRHPCRPRATPSHKPRKEGNPGVADGAMGVTQLLESRLRKLTTLSAIEQQQAASIVVVARCSCQRAIPRVTRPIPRGSRRPLTSTRMSDYFTGHGRTDFHVQAARCAPPHSWRLAKSRIFRRRARRPSKAAAWCCSL